MHNNEHLAALVPSDEALILNTIRGATEMRPADELNLPCQGKTTTSLKPTKLRMAVQLISQMIGLWKADVNTDTFAAAVEALVKHQVDAGKTEQITLLEYSADASSALIVVNLTVLLAKRLPRPKVSTGKKPAPVSSCKPCSKAEHKGGRLTHAGCV